MINNIQGVLKLKMIFDSVHSNNSQEKDSLPNASPRTKDIFGSVRGLSLFEECHKGTIFEFYIMHKYQVGRVFQIWVVCFIAWCIFCCTGQCHKDLEDKRKSGTEEPLIGKGMVKNRRKQFEYK